MLKPGLYKHYKGNEYRVLGLVKHSETREDMVLYQALHGSKGMWVRPLAMFEEIVDKDGYTGPRFIRLG